jgi:hypothetical protein
VGDQLVARPLPVHKHRKTHIHIQTLNIHAMSRIRTHDPGFRESEESTCLTPLGSRDWPFIRVGGIRYFFLLLWRAQSAQRLATGWTSRGSELESRWGQEFSLLHSVQIGSWANPASYPMGTGGSFSWGNAGGA